MMSVAVIAFSTSQRGREMAEQLLKKRSQLAWHVKLSVDQFVPSLPGRATHTPVWHRALCQCGHLSRGTGGRLGLGQMGRVMKPNKNWPTTHSVRSSQTHKRVIEQEREGESKQSRNQRVMRLLKRKLSPSWTLFFCLNWYQKQIVTLKWLISCTKYSHHCSTWKSVVDPGWFGRALGTISCSSPLASYR